MIIVAGEELEAKKVKTMCSEYNATHGEASKI